MVPTTHDNNATTHDNNAATRDDNAAADSWLVLARVLEEQPGSGR
jgi:hypothetical protein